MQVLTKKQVDSEEKEYGNLFLVCSPMAQET